MPSDTSSTTARTSMTQVAWRHLLVLLVCALAGAAAGWLYAGSSHPVHTSTVRVLINPSEGNPFSPTPASVRQDELTSLETEAQVARSGEVLGTVASETLLDTSQLSANTQVTVPANTQILEISYSATDPRAATRIADAVAQAYLDNRQQRSQEVKDARIEQVKAATVRVVDDLRSATADAQQGTAAQRAFHARLADALRNELVSLRAQRSSLESVQAPVGTVISPASQPAGDSLLRDGLIAAAGGVLGLVVGYLLALLLERRRGTVHHPREVEAQDLDVIAAAPPDAWVARLRRVDRSEKVTNALRRLRARLLAEQPRPQVITVVPATPGQGRTAGSAVIAESFARAGHRVVLVGHDDAPTESAVRAQETGLASALLHERLDVHDLLQPSTEPMLSLLSDADLTSETRELLTGDRMRSVLSALVEEGYLVVIDLREADSAEGDAYLAAADVALVIVVTRRTRLHGLQRLLAGMPEPRGRVAGFVVGPHDLERPRHRHTAHAEPDVEDTTTSEAAEVRRTPR